MRHLSHMERIEKSRITLFLGNFDRPAEGLLKHPERSPPSSRITITQMRSQALDRGRHKLLEGGGAGLGLRGLAWPATEPPGGMTRSS